MIIAHKIKLTNPYTKWQIVKITVAMTAIIFFRAIEKNKNARHGAKHSNKITKAFVIPI